MGRIKKAVKRVTAAAVRMFDAWSYSRYKDHRTCPRFAHWKHILKKPEGPKSPAMARGGDIHKEGERYLLGKDANGKKIPDAKVPLSFKLFRKEMMDLRKAKAIAEGKWAMNARWGVADWWTAWCRLVLDAHHYMAKGRRARVIDFKTGKVYLDDNLEQVELYAIAALSHYDSADEVQVELWYLDQQRGKENPLVRVYKRKQVLGLQKKWEGKTIPIMTDRRFIPNPNFTCGRCDYSHRKGGECEH